MIRAMSRKEIREKAVKWAREQREEEGRRRPKRFLE